MTGSEGQGGSQPPAGWYVDETSGGERWWDGVRWTEHRRQTAESASQPPWLGGDGTWNPGQRAEPAAATTSGSDDRTWAIAAHLSPLVFAFVGLPFLGPLIVYLVKRDQSPFVRAHSAAALNFQISWLLWSIALGIATFVLLFVLVGFLLLPVLIIGAVAWLALTIIAGVKASGMGRPMRYPLTVHFVD